MARTGRRLGLLLFVGLAACGGEGIDFERELGLEKPVLFIDGAAPIATGLSGVSFGEVRLGASASRTFVVKNLGTGTLTLSPPEVLPPFTWDFRGSTALGFAEQTEVEVGFTPPAEGLWRMILALRSNGGSWSIDLTGTGAR